MSIINSDGLNTNWQLNVLRGIQTLIDNAPDTAALQALLQLIEQHTSDIDLNTDNVEFILTSILTTLQAGTEYEAKFVTETCPGPPVTQRILLEVRLWDTDTSTWGPITYYLAGSTTPTTIGAGCTVAYSDPNGLLAQILNVLNTIENTTSQITFTGNDLNTSSNIQVGGTDVSNANPVPISDAGGSITVDGTVSLSTGTLSALESITVQNGAGASAVNIQDGGNVISIDDAGGSITVDGIVALDAGTLSALENITVQNGIGAAAVNIQDGGNSITVDGTISVGNFPTTQNVAVTSIVEVEVKNDSGNPLPISGTVTITDGSGPLTVDATDLDIRNLTFATDKVDISGSNVLVTGAVTATIDCADSSIAICGTDGVTNNVAINVSPAGQLLTQSSTLDGAGTPITSTTAGSDTGLDVNVIGGTMAVTQSTSPWIVNTNSVIRVPSVLRTTGGSTIPPGARSFSIFNAGSGTASILGGTNNLLAGEEVDFVAGGNDTFGLITFNGNGVTTLVVTYVS